MDRILTAFLEHQLVEGTALAADSDLFELLPVEPRCPQRYLVIYRCRGLVRDVVGGIVEADRFTVGISFSDDYLRAVDPYTVLTWMSPRNIWHPNIQPPFVCAGAIVAGTPLVDLLYRCFEIITFNRVTMREDDALCRDACSWSRRNGQRIPVDTRPLRRPAAGFEVTETPR